MGKLEKKVAIVTGASKGIGAEIAKVLAAEGASVAVSYATSRKDADVVVAAIARAGGKAFAVQGDVAKKADAERIVEDTVAKYGRLDVLVNNAGVYAFSPLAELSEAEFHRQYGVNVLGLLLVTQAASKHLGEGASIINVGSVVSSIHPPNSTIYTGTKGAVDAITGVLAHELAPRKIRVNSVNPGMVVTEGARAAGMIGSDFETDVVARTPLGRTGRVRDVATIAAFLASDDAAWLTGEIVAASGGLR